MNLNHHQAFELENSLGTRIENVAISNNADKVRYFSALSSRITLGGKEVL
jgi:hypothetical protein